MKTKGLNKMILMMKKVIFLTFLLINISSCSETESVTYSDIQEFNYSFEIMNQLGRDVENANLSLFLPYSQSVGQHLLSHKVAGTFLDDYRIIQDGLGNQIIYFVADKVKAGYRATINIAFKAAFSEEENVVDPNLNQYLFPIDNEVSLIEGIEITESMKPSEKITKIITHINSILSNNTEGSQDVSEDAKGKEDEQMVALTKTFRAYGFPAKRVIGFDTNKIDGGKITKENLVVWVEYHDAGRWHIVNLLDGKFIQSSTKYMGLRILDDTAHFNSSHKVNALFESFALNAQLR